MSVNDLRSQREAAEAAVVEAVAIVLHDHGPMNGQDAATERWQDCPGGEIHGAVADKVASTMAVQALLDVVELLRKFDLYASTVGSPDYNGSPFETEVREALARLPEEVRRG